MLCPSSNIRVEAGRYHIIEIVRHPIRRTFVDSKLAEMRALHRPENCDRTTRSRDGDVFPALDVGEIGLRFRNVDDTHVAMVSDRALFIKPV